MHHCWWCSLLHQETALLDRQPGLPMQLRVLVHDTVALMTYIQMQNCLSYCSFCISGQQQGTSGPEDADRNHIDHIFFSSLALLRLRPTSVSRTGHPLSPLICVRCAGAALSSAFSPVHFDGRLSLLYPDSNRRPLVGSFCFTNGSPMPMTKRSLTISVVFV